MGVGVQRESCGKVPSNILPSGGRVVLSLVENCSMKHLCWEQEQCIISVKWRM